MQKHCCSHSAVQIKCHYIKHNVHCKATSLDFLCIGRGGAASVVFHETSDPDWFRCQVTASYLTAPPSHSPLPPYSHLPNLALSPYPQEAYPCHPAAQVHYCHRISEMQLPALLASRQNTQRTQTHIHNSSVSLDVMFSCNFRTNGK